MDIHVVCTAMTGPLSFVVAVVLLLSISYSEIHKSFGKAQLSKECLIVVAVSYQSFPSSYLSFPSSEIISGCHSNH